MEEKDTWSEFEACGGVKEVMGEVDVELYFQIADCAISESFGGGKRRESESHGRFGLKSSVLRRIVARRASVVIKRLKAQIFGLVGLKNYTRRGVIVSMPLRNPGKVVICKFARYYFVHTQKRLLFVWYNS